MSETFLNSVRLIILDNLDMEDFGVKELAVEVGISRYQLYRKIQKIKSKSVSRFICEVRLEKALLINEGELCMSEIFYLGDIPFYLADIVKIAIFSNRLKERLLRHTLFILFGLLIILISILFERHYNPMSASLFFMKREVKYYNFQLPKDKPVSFFNSSQAIGGQASLDISKDGNSLVYAPKIDGVVKLALRNSNKTYVQIPMPINFCTPLCHQYYL